MSGWPSGLVYVFDFFVYIFNKVRFYLSIDIDSNTIEGDRCGLLRGKSGIPSPILVQKLTLRESRI